MAGFDSSVVSYPGRGPWGQSAYRGNCSGYIIKGFLETYHPVGRREALFVDPMMGGGTSRDVARELGIPFVGLDLKTGFDVLSISIQQAIGGRKAATVFTHPAYRGMIKYSADARDMSNAPDTAIFVQQMQLMGLNIYEALENGGFYAVLMGFWRHEGVYEPLASILAFPGLMPGLLTAIIVKVQHNTTSERNHYSGRFVPIMHEEMVVFKKGGPMNYALLDFADQFSRMLNQVHAQTWRNVVRAAMLEYPNQPMSPKEVFELVMQMGAQKTSSNANVDAKVRQVLKTYPEDFERVGRGKYALAN